MDMDGACMLNSNYVDLFECMFNFGYCDFLVLFLVVPSMVHVRWLLHLYL